MENVHTNPHKGRIYLPLVKILHTMKNILLLILVGSVHLLASENTFSQSARVSLDMEGTTVATVLNEIENQSDFLFLYNSSLVDVQRRVDVQAKNEKIANVLARLFSGSGIRYVMVGQQIILTPEEVEPSERGGLTLTPSADPNDSETNWVRVITGRVSSEEGEPLIGANILVQGTATGTVTDIDGSYQLEVEDDAEILVFSYTGYEPTEIEIGDRTVIDVVLSTSAAMLDEVVVTGYGTQRRSDVTGAVASIDQEKLENQPNTSFVQALQGAMPGVTISNFSASAEGGQAIQVRGRTSITANSAPLVVVDGVPYNGALAEINQKDIQSIDVLKDASSAAIYGARGANGVILITTKKGKIGAPRISYDGYFGIQEMGYLPEIMSADQFYAFKLDRERNEAGDPNLPPEMAFTPSELDVFQNGQGTDWIDEATRTGYQQQHNLSISGGSERSNYYISGSWLGVKGVAKNDDFKRFTVRLNFSTQITDWLELGTNTQLSETDRSHDPADFNAAFTMNPLTRAYDDNGDLTIFPWPEDIFPNPLSGLNNIRDDKLRRVFTNNYLDVKLNFLPGLSYRLNTGYNFRNREVGRYRGRNTVAGFVNGGVSDVSNGITTDLLVENILSYARQFGDHSIGATALYSFQQLKDESHSTYAQGFPNDVMTYYQPSLGNLVIPEANFSEQDYLSYMGRINYSFKDKYLLTVTGRRDGYSAFGADKKFGFFPSFALGWHLGREGFMESVAWMDQLKLRVSYGENGNQAIDPYTTLSKMTADAYLGGSDGQTILPGFYPSSIGTTNLGWETTKSTNFGVDFGFFQNRLQGSVDYYVANTYDLLLNRTISPVHGVSTFLLQNIGEVRNRGFEVQLSSVNLHKGGFKWTTDLNVTVNRNEIVDLYGDKQDDLSNQWFIGRPIDVNYDYVIDGIWQESDNIADGPQPDLRPGDVRIKDSNNDGTIDNLDREIIGSLQPDFIAGMTNEISFKNFTLNFFIYTVQGVTRQNTLLEPDEVWVDTRRNTVHRTDYWTPENMSDTYPANRNFTNILFAGFYEDASFIRLRDISLSYDFNPAFCNRIGLNNLRFYVSGRNLVTITKWTGLDPELGNQRNIPLNRIFLAGVRVGL